jgi:hypothetical protein
MAKTLQLRRYPANVISTMTGAVGEVYMDLTNNTLVVQDGVTEGGYTLAKVPAAGTYITSAASTQIVSNFGNLAYSTVKYLVQCVAETMESKELLVTNNGTTASVLLVANTASAASTTCVFSANIDSSGNVNLLVTPTRSNIIIDYTTVQPMPYRPLNLALPPDLQVSLGNIDLNAVTLPAVDLSNSPVAIVPF